MNGKLHIVTASAAVVVGAVLVLTGCASHSASASPKSSGTGQSQAGQGGAAQGGQGGPGGFGGGGTSGQIADIEGSTLQVQDSSSQTAVTYSSSTAITKTVSVSLAAVRVGECITASRVAAGGVGSGAGSSSSTSSTSADAPVTSVSISQPTTGSCTAGFGPQGGGAGRTGQGGTHPTARPTARPSNRPSGAPTGGFGGRAGFAIPTSGKVTAVSGSTITVDALDFQTQKTTSKKVTVNGSTTYSETQKGAASDLVVGQCVLARGKADDSGTVAATSLMVSAPVNGSCTVGFAGPGFGSGLRGSNGSGSGSQSGTTNG